LFRGYANNASATINKDVLKIIKEELGKIKPQEIDYSPIITILEEIKNKEIKIDIPDNSELIDRVDELSNKMNFEPVIKLLKKKPTEKIIIKEDNQKTLELLEKIMMRQDIQNDPDFKKLVKKKQKDIELIQQLILQNDPDFISLLQR
jgi:hypothetical protein